MTRRSRSSSRANKNNQSQSDSKSDGNDNSVNSNAVPNDSLKSISTRIPVVLVDKAAPASSPSSDSESVKASSEQNKDEQGEMHDAGESLDDNSDQTKGKADGIMNAACDHDDGTADTDSRPTKTDADADADMDAEAALNADDDKITKNHKEEKETEANDSNKNTTDEAQNEAQNDEDEEQEEQWDLTHIFSIDQLTIQDNPQTCMTKSCPLIACATWTSSLPGNDKWHTCIDCQEADYGGWPETAAEMPVKFLTLEHRKVMVEKCTGQYSPEMPKIAINEKGDLEEMESDDAANVETNAAEMMSDGAENAPSPIPKNSSNNKSSSQPNNPVPTSSLTPPPPGTIKKKKKTKASLLVTPSPVPPSKSGKVFTRVPIPSKSKAMYEKWQKECVKMGGTGKIVVHKPEIKQLILNMLRDAFCPMNITQIYNKLKGTVPTVLLKTCLDDMALDHFKAENQFVDSDDEDDIGGKSKTTLEKNVSSQGDEFAGSLMLKPGRNANTSLYFVDYSKLSNNGDGLLPQDKNDLVCAQQNAQNELDYLQKNEKNMNDEAATLLSEPINADAVNLLEKAEAEITELREEVNACAEFKDNAKHCKLLKRKVEVMAAQWRKRKRLCLEFLNFMEDATDGTVSTKKCMSGDGQMDIDSDEAVIRGQIAFVKQKRSRGSMMNKCYRVGGGDIANKRQKTNNAEADDSFVGVTLKVGRVERIYLEN